MKRTKAPAGTSTTPPPSHSLSEKAKTVSDSPPADKSRPHDSEEKPGLPARRNLNRSELPSILFEGDEIKSTEPIEPPQKFSTGPAAASTAPDKPETLPESYGTGTLMLTARDPRCLYAHWDVTTQQMEQYAGLSLGTRLVLRVHQESASGPLLRELPVEPGSHSSFVAVDAPDAKRFVADLGYYPVGGGWKTVATGDTAAISASPRSVEEVRFTTLPFAAEITDTSASPVPVGVSDIEGSRSEQPLIARDFPLPDRFSVRSVKPATEEELAEPLGQPATKPRAPVFGPEWVGDAEGLLEEWEGVAEEPALASTGTEVTWTTAQANALAEVIGWSVKRSEAYSSLELGELLQGIREEKVSVPAIEGLVSIEKGQISSVGLASAPAPSPQEHGFWFNVNAELVIYGATEPNAVVTIGGRPVALRPDGTFSCRFALPDGDYPLLLAANSIRGEVRQAELRFSRNTFYSEGTGVHPLSSNLKRPGEDL